MGLIEIVKLKDEGGFSRSSEAELREMLNECEAQLFGRMAAEAKSASDAIRTELASRSITAQARTAKPVKAHRVPPVLIIAIVISALGVAALILYLRWRDGTG